MEGWISPEILQIPRKMGKFATPALLASSMLRYNRGRHRAIGERPIVIHKLFNPPGASFTPRAERMQRYEDRSLTKARLHVGGNHDRGGHHRIVGRHRHSQLRACPHQLTAKLLHREPASG